MKTVFTNAMCAHVWAQQTQPEGRANSMRFAGPVMFYHATPVAMMHSAKGGAKACLITSQSYSQSTNSQCLPHVRRAIPVTVRCFFVPWVGFDGPRGWDASEPSHAANAAYLKRLYELHAERMRKMRGFDERAEVDTLARMAAVLDDYCWLFGLPREILNVAETARDVMSERAERSTPEAKAKRAKAAEKKREHEAAGRAQRQYDWRHNRPVHCHPDDRLDATGGALLRVVGRNVQTSLGAVVPLEDARRALKFIKREHVPGEQRSVFPVTTAATVGLFRIDAIHADGSITAGCHKISAAELKLFEDSLAALP